MDSRGVESPTVYRDRSTLVTPPTSSFSERQVVGPGVSRLGGTETAGVHVVLSAQSPQDLTGSGGSKSPERHPDGRWRSRSTPPLPSSWRSVSGYRGNPFGSEGRRTVEKGGATFFLGKGALDVVPLPG